MDSTHDFLAAYFNQISILVIRVILEYAIYDTHVERKRQFQNVYGKLISISQISPSTPGILMTIWLQISFPMQEHLNRHLSEAGENIALHMLLLCELDTIATRKPFTGLQFIRDPITEIRTCLQLILLRNMPNKSTKLLFLGSQVDRSLSVSTPTSSDSVSMR